MFHELVPTARYEAKKADAVRQFKALRSQGKRISIKKNTRHIFKERSQEQNLDLSDFNQVLGVDTQKCIATVEGMASFYDLVDATLPFNLMPQAVPELRSITVGGAIAGLGGQSSSFRFGLVHEMVTGFDLLTGEGKVIYCSAESNPDLFYMLPNSYGSLGYVLKCHIKLNRVSPYVKLQYVRYPTAADFFDDMAGRVESGGADFIEGVSFSAGNYVLLLGSFTEELPTSANRVIPLHEPFFSTVQDPANTARYMTIHDYIWRWDPDAYWATNQRNLFGAILLNRNFRRTLGRYLLRSDRLVKIGQIRNRLRKRGIAKYIFLESNRKEALIQDAALPFDTAQAFDAWLATELKVYPLWYCPVRTTKPLGTYPLYQPESEFVLDFGFYTSVDLEDDMDPYFYNRQIERKLLALGGLKCLYSDTFFDQEQFWSIYDRDAYERVKRKYDPDDVYLDLYDKVINEAG